MGIWSSSLFHAIQTKATNKKIFKVLNKDSYTTFVNTGQSYLKILKEKTFGEQALANNLEDGERDIQNSPNTGTPPKAFIDSESVLAWLLLQANENKRPYEEILIRQYIRYLRSIPPKLDLCIDLEDRNVFACCTVPEFSSLWETFKSAPNYKKVDAKTHGGFSAALNCYMRHLTHLSTTFCPAGENKTTDPDSPGLSTDTTIALDNNVKIFVINLLVKHFPNGFKVDSFIELTRFRQFIIDDYNTEISMTDEELKESITDCGTLFDGKIYIISDDAKKRIQKEIDTAIINTTNVVYYSVFYEKHWNYLRDEHIVSEEMVKIIVEQLYPQYYHKKNYVSVQRNCGIEFNMLRTEILRVWGDEAIRGYEEISACLPYIPLAKLKQTLAQDPNFIWNTVGTYTHIDKIEITEQECTNITNDVFHSIDAMGYASLASVPLGDIQERNFQLSLSAVHNAIMKKCLVNRYQQRGKIIIPLESNVSMDVASILRGFCKKSKKYTLDELLEFERELTGEIHRSLPMEAAYATMIRADKNTFVAEVQTFFDVNEIDNALESFIEENFLPLQSITTFAIFPDCGISWNLFVLESYCRRFSRKFRFDVTAVNSQNTGVIIRKTCCLPYLEIMVEAVVKSGIKLQEKEILAFLTENGYISRRSYAKINELITKATVLQKGIN